MQYQQDNSNILYHIYVVSFYSTASNCPAPINNEDSTGIDGESTKVNPEERGTAQVVEKTGSTKCKTKTQAECDNNIDKIMKIAQVEDHPVELALTAVAKQMIRTLSADEQDKLLDEIQTVSAKYFRKCRKKLKRDAEQASPPVSVVRTTPPPPPLTPAGQSVQTGLQHAEIQQLQDQVLVEVGSLPPMDQYTSAVQYVTSPDTGATYMQLN